MPHYADIESVVQALDQAASPVDAVQVVLRWLGDQHGPAAIRLLNDAEIITGPHQVIDNEVLDWLRQPANWRDWLANNFSDRLLPVCLPAGFPPPLSPVVLGRRRNLRAIAGCRALGRSSGDAQSPR